MIIRGIPNSAFVLRDFNNITVIVRSNFGYYTEA